MGTSNSTKQTTAAAQVRNNAQAAQVCALGATDKCAFCQRTGVPILPLRYAVIPEFLKGRPENPLVAASKLGTTLKAKPLGSHKYTVRALRKGFVHVYLGTPGKWQSYAVTEAGHLRLLANPDDVDAKTDRKLTAQCASQGHNIPASFINIPPQFANATVWIAFAQDPWPKSVRQKYEKSPTKRMQSFDCAALVASPDALDDALEITSDPVALGQLVEEYATSPQDQTKRHDYKGEETVDANKNKKFDELAGRWQSVHGTAWRTGELPALGKAATARHTATKGKEKLAAVVLHDAVGMVQELNAMRMLQINFRSEYSASVQRQHAISEAIKGLREITKSGARAALVKQEEKSGTADKQTHYIPGRPGYAGMGGTQGYSYTDTRTERADKAGEAAWPRLLARYDENSRQAFEDGHKKRMAQYAATVLAYDADYAIWSRDPAWLEWFKDYNPANADDCLGMARMAAPCLSGGAISEHSRGLWLEWLDSKKPGDADNPVYQSLLAGQKSLIDFLLPDGLNAFPSDAGVSPDSVDKGDNTFDAVKGLMSSDEWKKVVATSIHEPVAAVMQALGGAVNLLGDQLSKQAELTALRAQQAALKAYRNVDVSFITLEMKLVDYHKYLGEMAFKKLYSQVDDLVRKGSTTVKSIAIAGVLAITDPELSEKVVRVTVWTLGKLEDVKAALHAAVGNLKREVDAGAAAALAVLRFGRHGLTLGHDTARAIGQLGSTVRLSAEQMGRFAKTLGQRSGSVLRTAASADVLLAAGAVFFQAWSFRDGWREMEQKFGKQRTEAAMGVLADGIGVLVGVGEIVGTAMHRAVFGKGMTAWGNRVLAGAGYAAAIAAAVESVQAFAGSARTLQAGDRDAGRAYFVAGLLFGLSAAATGAATGLGSAALLGGAGALLGIGPLGWAILLGIAAVAALWWAINAEDTAAEVWLDRCLYGYGKRRAGRWTDAQQQEELSELNAVLLGLKAEIDWEDNIGKDGVMIRLTMPGFSVERSAYEYQVLAKHVSTGWWIPIVGGRYRIPEPPMYFKPWDGVRRGPDLSSAFEFSNRHKNSYTEKEADGPVVHFARDGFLLDESQFTEAKIEFKYWYDLADDEAVSTITHLIRD